MSRFGSPSDGSRGALAAPRDAGRRRATRLIALVAVPTVLGLALTGLRVTDATRSAETYGQVSRLAVLGQQVTGLAQAMEDERADTDAFMAAAGRPAAASLALHRQYGRTDGWSATVRRLVVRLGPGSPARTRASATAVLASISELPGLRRQAAQRQAAALAVINGYSAAIAGLLPVTDGIADLTGSAALTASVRALGALSRMTDQAAQQQDILGGALADGRFGPGVVAALTIAQAQQASDLASFRSSATPEESRALAETLGRPLAVRALTIEQRVTGSAAGGLALGTHARQEWLAGMTYTVSWMRHAEHQLAAWITAYAQSLQRSATRSAFITGGAALALLIVVLLATGKAVRLAGEEARARGSIGIMYAAFFQRSHSLLERLLRMIDSLELAEDDPERLAGLFQLDHLATRLRRSSDSALALAGRETPHHRTEPVTLVNVFRAAVSEIEQYDRIVLNVQQGVSVSGSAAADTVHLLAELLDNAATFSPEATRVVMSGRTVRGGGSLISITDSGTGIPEEQLGELNSQLARPRLADVQVARPMGLHAVARLAERHGIEVALGPSPDGGTTAEVHLPAALISLDVSPGGGAEFSAGPQFAAGPEAAAPGAVPLPLGAPLPSPAASLAATGPEPARAEQGGTLPIFESVESEYLHKRGQGWPGPGEPPAGAAQTSAGLPRRPQVTASLGAAADRDTRHADTAASAQIALGRLASFQRGSRRARTVTRIDRDANQPSQAD